MNNLRWWAELSKVDRLLWGHAIVLVLGSAGLGASLAAVGPSFPAIVLAFTCGMSLAGINAAGLLRANSRLLAAMRQQNETILQQEQALEQAMRVVCSEVAQRLAVELQRQDNGEPPEPRVLQ